MIIPGVSLSFNLANLHTPNGLGNLGSAVASKKQIEEGGKIAMKSNKIKTLVLGVSLVAMVLLGVGSTTAQAQHRGHHRPIVVYRSYWGPSWGWYDPFWGPTYRVVDPIAQARESGYSDGHSRGKDDAKHGKANAPESHKHFRNSDSQTYRQAFLQGYADGYREKMGEIREKYGR